MIFSGIVDFEHPYNRSTHYTILDHFIKSNDDCLELEWEKIGYKDLNACHSSWNWSIRYFKLPLVISRIDNHIYIFKEGSWKTNYKTSFDITKISLEERYNDDEYNTTTLYFKAPKEMLRRAYRDVIDATISVEFPSDNPIPAYCSVMMSPTGSDFSDYDWTDYTLSYSDIQKLLDLADKTIEEGTKC